MDVKTEEEPWVRWARRYATSLQKGQLGAAERNCRRSLITKPDVGPLYVDFHTIRTAAGADGRNPRSLRRASLLVHLEAGVHFRLAMVLARSISDEGLPDRDVINQIRRAVILEPDHADRVLHCSAIFRLAGAVDDMLRTLLHGSVLANEPPAKRQKHRDNLSAFQRRYRSQEDLTVAVDFPARVLGDRVVLHPRLPGPGPWDLVGPADQVDKARQILGFVNRDAEIRLAGEVDGPAGQRLSVVPDPDPGTWLFPCLMGHGTTGWTVLPVVLDAEGRFSEQRALAYHTRTRRIGFMQYEKGNEPAIMRRNEALGRHIAAGLADEESRASYLETLSCDLDAYARSYFRDLGRKLQYFDYARYRPGDVVLNLGVAEGFEVPAYLALISPGGVLHNIDPMGHDGLGAPARQWIEGSDATVVEHRQALSNVDGELEFDVGGCYEDRRVDKRRLGKYKRFPSARFDSFIRDQGLDRIDHIKLDIEGGEGFLLDQLIEVMRTHRPQIEISIYHTIEQFFVIPQRMMADSRDYSFFFYRYSADFSEATLYAIPNERLA